jgi:hypothetical protein
MRVGVLGLGDGSADDWTLLSATTADWPRDVHDRFYRDPLEDSVYFESDRQPVAYDPDQVRRSGWRWCR